MWRLGGGSQRRACKGELKDDGNEARGLGNPSETDTTSWRNLSNNLKELTVDGGACGAKFGGKLAARAKATKACIRLLSRRISVH